MQDQTALNMCVCVYIYVGWSGHVLVSVKLWIGWDEAADNHHKYSDHQRTAPENNA